MKKGFKYFLATGCIALFVAMSCSKKDEEEVLPYMKGELKVVFPSYVVAGSYIDGSVEGVIAPEDVTYYWVCDEEPMLFKDTVKGQIFHLLAPEDLNTFEVRCQAWRTGYYGMLERRKITVMKAGFHGGSLSGATAPTDSITDSRDNRRYYIKEIGSLQWFAENLDYAGTSSKTYGVAYDNSVALESIFGRLYSWEEATGGVSASGLGNGPQGLCPDGWSVPTREDWEDLAKTVNGGQPLSFDDMWAGLAGKLTPEAAINGVNMWSYSPDFEKNDEWGWNAFPCGNSVDSHSRFQNMSSYGMWWSASELNNDLAAYRYIGYEQDFFAPGYNDKKEFGASVRCVRKI